MPELVLTCRLPLLLLLLLLLLLSSCEYTSVIRCLPGEDRMGHCCCCCWFCCCC